MSNLEFLSEDLLIIFLAISQSQWFFNMIKIIFLLMTISANDLSYKSYDNVGLNKLERINQIETYLSKLKGHFEKTKSNSLKSDMKLEKKISSVKSKLTTLDSKITALAASIPKPQSQKNNIDYKKDIDELKQANSLLTSKVTELEVQLKTLQELFKRNKELKSRTTIP